MRIKVADATGSPVPQFIVYADNDAERVLLANFAKYAYKPEYTFRFHGATYESGHPGAETFNFGVIPNRKRVTYKKTLVNGLLTIALFAAVGWPFLYWLFHPELSQMQVWLSQFLWWAGGIILICISLLVMKKQDE